MFKGICSKTLLTYTGKKQHNSMYPIVHQDKVGWQGNNNSMVNTTLTTSYSPVKNTNLPQQSR